MESYLDGYSTDIEILIVDVEGNTLLSGDVPAGKKLRVI